MNGFLHQPAHHTLYQALQWVQSCPPLFTDNANALFLNHPLPDGSSPLLPDIGQLNALASLVKKKGNPLLGIFYETLWQFLLSQLPDSDVIASNLQVKSGKSGQSVTLGEYDLLYQFRQQCFHRELAVKFYLGIPGKKDAGAGSPWQHWVGPGLKDRLDRKMGRLLNHQITLTDTEEGLETLKNLGIKLPIHKEILIQGRLFYPLYPLATTEIPPIPLTEVFRSNAENHTAPLCPPPKLSNPDHLQGYWLTQRQLLLGSRPVTEHFHYQVPDKIQWLNLQCTSIMLEHNQLMGQLKQQNRPVYVKAFHQELQDPVHLFIVPDGWPIKAEITVHQ